jgi:hypothetical protein
MGIVLVQKRGLLTRQERFSQVPGGVVTVCLHSHGAHFKHSAPAPLCLLLGCDGRMTLPSLPLPPCLVILALLIMHAPIHAFLHVVSYPLHKLPALPLTPYTSTRGTEAK